MANSINRVIVSGNATRDPELNRTQGGMAILNIGIAVNDRRKNQQTGEWEDYANFFDVRVFGNRAESLAGIVTKGMYLTIEGKLRWSQWEREGQKRSKVEIIADEVVLPPRQSGQNGSQGGYQQQGGGYNPNGYSAPQNAPQQPQGGYQQAPQPQHAPQYESTSDIYSDDVPF